MINLMHIDDKKNGDAKLIEMANSKDYLLNKPVISRRNPMSFLYSCNI